MSVTTIDDAFVPYPKIPRLFRKCVVTEKIDGTNGLVYIGEDGTFKTGSRNRWVTPDNDNFGFSAWAHEHKEELMELGPGRYYGEWYGRGIQRGYGLEERRFALFNVHIPIPDCCRRVPVLKALDVFDTAEIEACMEELWNRGSFAVPGYPDPEGVIVFHEAGRTLYKALLFNDREAKGQVKENRT